MSVIYRTGDLFAQDDVQALAHGVNCRGVMGAGIAVAFKQRFPLMYAQYKMLCKIRELQLGDVFPWYDVRQDVYVFNMASQDLPGAHASLLGLETSLLTSLVWANELGLSEIAIPRIGCGIGGLEWDDVQEIIESTATRIPGTDILVVTP